MHTDLDRLISRRSALRRGACASLGLGALASQLFTVRMVNAALAGQAFTDYKALVSIFLFGGNDNGNTIIPFDGGPQNYDFYAATRGALALPQSQLTDTIITPTNTDGRRFALHPSLVNLRNLFEQGNLAIVSNVGTLVEPTSRTEYFNHLVRLPPQLFAHDWQQELWQISTADSVEKVGWGGRIADSLQAVGANAGAKVSMGISIAGNNLFLAGRNVTPFTVSSRGPRLLDTSFLSDTPAEQAAIRTAFTDLLALQNNPKFAGANAMQQAYSDITQRAIVNSEQVASLLALPTAITAVPPPGNQLAGQLYMVARLIEHAQSKLKHNRQVFYVAMGGFDSHDGLINGTHAGLLGNVDAALKFFWDALGQISMREKVTTHTASDFGRTYVSNGNGSDHGWGSHHFVMGGTQVAGRRICGQFPDLTINGPDDTGNGRYIPTRSVDEYAFELAKWMGVPLSEMPTIFPNLTRFLDPQNPATHIGFMA